MIIAERRRLSCCAAGRAGTPDLPGPRAGARVRALVALAARHLHVPARRPVPPALQHAGALDVRRRSRAPCGARGSSCVSTSSRAIGAAATTLLVSLLPFGFSHEIYASVTVGASGAIYGLLVAFAMMHPAPADRSLYMLFPMPARLVVILIIGAISLYFVRSANRAAAWPTPPISAGSSSGYSIPRRAARGRSLSRGAVPQWLALAACAQASRKRRSTSQVDARTVAALDAWTQAAIRRRPRGHRARRLSSRPLAGDAVVLAPLQSRPRR
ncbi:MAG: rhomboid family intramembrane serine protease [Sphingobacterium sp.]|nr:rhomboid family intramembrane serine protease [Sphingobacterium sp.]